MIHCSISSLSIERLCRICTYTFQNSYSCFLNFASLLHIFMILESCKIYFHNSKITSHTNILISSHIYFIKSLYYSACKSLRLYTVMSKFSPSTIICVNERYMTKTPDAPLFDIKFPKS